MGSTLDGADVGCTAAITACSTCPPVTCARRPVQRSVRLGQFFFIQMGLLRDGETELRIFLYDVVHRSDSGRSLVFGYHTNELGFGWTNAVFTALSDRLSSTAARSRARSR